MNQSSSLTLNINEVIDFLKRRISWKEIQQQILFQKIIDRAAKERGIEVTAAEIQTEADNQRRTLRLEKAADTLAWLADRLITPDEWEAGIRDRLLAKKLAEALFTQEVEKFFAQNQLEFEQVLLYQIIVPYEKVAQELFYEIQEQEISFYEAAHLYDIDERRRQQCGYEGKLYRRNLKPDLAAAVFSAKPGDVIGPIKTEQGSHVLTIEEFIPAQLTPELRQTIIQDMFQEWSIGELNYLLHNQV